MRFALILVLILTQDPPGQDEIPGLIEALGSDYLHEREEAQAELRRAGKAAEGELIGALESDDIRIVLASVDLLREIGNTNQVGKVGALFKGGGDEAVLIKTFDYLVAAGAPAEDHLIQALDRRGDYFRRRALGALTRIKSVKAAGPAFRMYENEPDAAIRRMAFDLIRSGGAEARAYLVRFLDDNEETIRREAIEGLKGADDAETVEAVGRRFREEVQDSVIQAAFVFLEGIPDERAERIFIEALSARPGLTRRLAIGRLADMKSEKALDRVLEAAKTTTDLDVKEKCIKYFAQFPERTEEYLLKLLDDPEPKIRRKVITELTGSRSEVAYDKIRGILDTDKDELTRTAAFAYFTMVGKRARDVFLKGLEDKNAEIRRQAVDILGELRDAEAVPALLKAFGAETQEEPRTRIVQALGKIGKPAIQGIEEAVRSDQSLQPVLAQVRAIFVRSMVEGVLAPQIARNNMTDEEITGTFAGQFESLRALKVDAAGIYASLKAMLAEEYEPVTAKLEQLRNRDLLRRLAVLAMGALGHPEATEFLKAQFEELLKKDYHDVLIEDVVVALVELGDRGPAVRLIGKFVEEAEKILASDPHEAFEKLFAVNLMRNRTGDREGALKGYLELEERLKEVDEENRDHTMHSYVLYNIACLYSLAGEKAKAVASLEKAVRSGFRSKDWIEADKDLDPIRGEESYRALMADEKLFRKP